jgi:heptosyltransferase-3
MDETKFGTSASGRPMFRMRKIVPPARILVSKLGHIGDVLVITPFFKILKELFPQARITALVNQGTEEMVLNCPYVDRALLVMREKLSPGRRLTANWRLIRQLRAGGFDMAFELSAGDRGIYLCWLSGAKIRVGFASGKNKLIEKLLHIKYPRYLGGHEVDNFVSQLQILGWSKDAPPLQWLPNQADTERARQILRERNIEKFLLVHPTSRWMFKAWTPAKNAEVINYLADSGWNVVLTSGPEAREMEFIRQLCAQLRPGNKVLNLAGQLSLSLLGALLAKATAFFGVDSAPMHLAASLRIPTVVLFGPSGEHMWGPWRVKHKVLSGDCPQRPCGRDGCNGSKICNALMELPVLRVCRALDEILTPNSGN